MGTVDRAIAIGGLALLVAAGAGLVYTQEFAGLQEISFPTRAFTLEAQEGAVGSAGTTFVWPAGNLTGPFPNATAYQANISVEVRFDGQALQGGEATIQMVLHPPSGEARTYTETLSIPTGATTATATFDIGAQWAPVPEGVRVQPGSLDAHRTWSDPLQLEVKVDRPGDLGANLPTGVSYSFQATAEPTVRIYEQAVKA